MLPLQLHEKMGKVVLCDKAVANDPDSLSV